MSRLSEYVELVAFVIAACLSRRSARRADDTDSDRALRYEDLMAPVMSTVDYVTALMEGTKASPCVFTSALVLLEKGVSAGTIVLTPGNANVLYGVAVTLAIKWHEDFYFTNASYAALCCVPLKEFNSLEREFLGAIDYRASITESALAYAEAKAVEDACDSCMGDLLKPELKNAGLLPLPQLLVEEHTPPAISPFVFSPARAMPIGAFSPITPISALSATFETPPSSQVVFSRALSAPTKTAAAKPSISPVSSPSCSTLSWDVCHSVLQDLAVITESPPVSLTPARGTFLARVEECTPAVLPTSGLAATPLGFREYSEFGEFGVFGSSGAFAANAGRAAGRQTDYSMFGGMLGLHLAPASYEDVQPEEVTFECPVVVDMLDREYSL